MGTHIEVPQNGAHPHLHTFLPKSAQQRKDADSNWPARNIREGLTAVLS